MLPAKNRTLLSLTNEQKAEICRYKRDNPKISNVNLARHFEKKFKLNLNDIKPTTLSGILKKSYLYDKTSLERYEHKNNL